MVAGGKFGLFPQIYWYFVLIPARKKLRSPFLQCCLLTVFVLFTSGVYAEDYIIAPGDLLAIKVFGEPDMSLDRARVAANGSISFPLLGVVRVQGYASRQLEVKLANLLRDGYLVKPRVSVSILEYRPFFVNGAVQSPGSYSYQEGMTVEKAITLAGGFGKDAVRGETTILREGSGDVESTSVGMRTKVRPGDVISVARSETTDQQFYVYGAVRSPGAYPYRNGLTVGKALALAGGLTARASKRKIGITREGETGSEKIHADLDTAVNSGDVIDIGKSIF